MLTVVMLSDIFFYCYAECHYAECRYRACHYAECHYAKCRYAAYLYDECLGANSQ